MFSINMTDPVEAVLHDGTKVRGVYMRHGEGVLQITVGQTTQGVKCTPTLVCIPLNSIRWFSKVDNPFSPKSKEGVV